MNMGKVLILTGIVLAAAGVLWMLGGRGGPGAVAGGHRRPRRAVHVLLPLATCIVLSVVLSLVDVALPARGPVSPVPGRRSPPLSLHVRYGHRRLTGLELRQDLLADLFEDLRRFARAVLEVEDDVVDADRAQPVEEAEYDVPAATDAQVDRLGRSIRVIGQVDVE